MYQLKHNIYSQEFIYFSNNQINDTTKKRYKKNNLES